ncbi:MAG: copper homeostasis protein CutC [Bacillota bacterium]
MKIEVIASTLEDALLIEDCGADRIELIMGFKEEGLTPSFGFADEVIKRVDIPVNVMIRTHNKDFFLSENDMLIMNKEIEIYKSLNPNGFVFGGITEDFAIDDKNMAILLEKTNGFECTFHACSNLFSSLKSFETLDNLGFARVLSKGGVTHISQNYEKIKEIKSTLKNTTLLVGGNINGENVEKVFQTGARELHVGTAVRENNSQVLGVNKKMLCDFVAKVRNLESEYGR